MMNECPNCHEELGYEEFIVKINPEFDPSDSAEPFKLKVVWGDRTECCHTLVGKTWEDMLHFETERERNEYIDKYIPVLARKP